MLVCTLEVWPGGREQYRQTIGEMKLGNVSGLAPVSDYVGEIDGEPVEVFAHLREAGAWELVRRVLMERKLNMLDGDG